MEENPVPQATPLAQPAPAPTTTIIHKKGPNMLLVMIIVFLLLVIVGGATFYFGLMKKPSTESSVAPSPTATATAEEVVTPATSPTPSVNLTKYTASKMKDLSFPAYSLEYPDGWKVTEEKNEIIQTTTLVKNGHTIKINQAPTGGSQCIFEGPIPEGPANDYTKTKYVEIDTGEVKLRRLVADGQNGTTVTHSFCSNSKSAPSSFGIPTVFGHLTYITPSTPDGPTLTEMDAIVKSLKTL